MAPRINLGALPAALRRWPKRFPQTIQYTTWPTLRRNSTARRQPLPPELPRIEHHHEPESCQCGADLVQIGKDVSEQLDMAPARAFLQRWHGHLMVDDYVGYKALFADGRTELACLAHIRRKFFDVRAASGSQVT